MEYNALMDQQRRPLSGMQNGVPIAVAAAAPATTLHTLDTGGAQDQNGRPYIDAVTLFIANADETADGAVTVSIGGVAMNVLIPMGEIVRVLDETPFGGAASGAGGGTITAVAVGGEGASKNFVAWGWFVRS